MTLEPVKLFDKIGNAEVLGINLNPNGCMFGPKSQPHRCETNGSLRLNVTVIGLKQIAV